jgi:cytochrome c oxidase subunit 2
MKKNLITFLLFIPTVSYSAEGWQLGFNEAATSVMKDIVSLHNHIILPIITVICIFVLLLLMYCIFQFRESKNPKASNISHNTFLEIAWTLIPCLILISIAIPSFKLLYKQDTIPKSEVTIKAIGYQWYWGFEYPDEKIAFESNIVEEKDLKPGQPRLLTTDNVVVLPVNKVVKVLVTSNDVLHAFAIPSFGINKEAVPGRVNETWFKVEKEGTYYGDCYELCGPRHAFMPIVVKVVSEKEYNEWVKQAKKKFAMYPGNNMIAKYINENK